MSPAYHQSVGGDLLNQSEPVPPQFVKRTAPMPDMMTFDAPSREVCVMKRSVTRLAPQQAFVLLNDTQFVEAARFWRSTRSKRKTVPMPRNTNQFRTVSPIDETRSRPNRSKSPRGTLDGAGKRFFWRNRHETNN